VAWGRQRLPVRANQRPLECEAKEGGAVCSRHLSRLRFESWSAPYRLWEGRLWEGSRATPKTTARRGEAGRRVPRAERHGPATAGRGTTGDGGGAERTGERAGGGART